MPVPRLRSAMPRIREILRLALGEGLSRRATGAATGLPYTTVSDHLVRAARAGLSWPLPDGLDDAQLEACLFAGRERTWCHSAPPEKLQSERPPRLGSCTSASASLIGIVLSPSRQRSSLSPRSRTARLSARSNGRAAGREYSWTHACR